MANRGEVIKVALVQLNVGDDPHVNLRKTIPLIREAAAQGATFILTPEVTNLLTPDRARRAKMLKPEAEDPTLSALRAEAKAAGVWLLIGSLALLGEGEDERFINRSFMINPAGDVTARYDKLHMFDVTISDTEQYHESATFRPGNKAVLTEMDGHSVGMTICYDLRFPHLYRRLAHAGAKILTIPAAFSTTTGKAHWEVLLRARAIETGCFVLAPAQCGTHPAPHSPNRQPRQSYGHSLAVDPWGKVLTDGGVTPGISVIELDLSGVNRARSRVPSLSHDRSFDGP